MTRIIIIGFMGAGKTTVGKELAKAIGLPFYDLDWYIQTRMRKTIAQIFEEKGEEGFRLVEHNMLHEVAEFENVVISCGGGTPCFFDNMDYMNQQGDVVYLKGTVDTIIEHIKMGKGVRPLLIGKTDEELRQYVTEQLKERETHYMKAKYVYDINLMDNFEKVTSTINEIRTLLNV